MLAALLFTLVSTAAQAPARADPKGLDDAHLAPLVEGFLAGYRAGSEIEQRRRCLEALAELTRDEERAPSPLVARALGEGLADESFALRARVLGWLAHEDPASVRALLPEAARALVGQSLALEQELAAREGALEQDSDAEQGPPRSPSEEALAKRAEVTRLGRKADELELYAGALAEALGAQGDTAALEGLLALGEARTRFALASPAWEALAQLPCRRALAAVVERIDALERARAEAAQEALAAQNARARGRVPRGWTRDAWRAAEAERLSALRARAAARVERLRTERERLWERLDALARAHELPRVPVPSAPPASWSRWWQQARAALPEPPAPR